MEGKDLILRLIMEKGQLEGQTLEFVPGSNIRIGRIARGNTISIKDAGISTKHLGINFKGGPGRAGRWTISDLGSSNGTFLNSDELEPFVPVKLSDGDVIKIGEFTSIRVRIGVKVEVEESKVVRTNHPRRRGGKLGVVDENSKLQLGVKNENGKSLKISVVSDSKDLNGEDNEKMKASERKENQKRTRGRKNEAVFEEKNSVKNVEEIGDAGRGESVANLRSRRGRGAKKDETVGACADLNLIGSEGMERKEGQVESSKRITRNSRKGGNLENVEDSGFQCSIGIENLKRTTRSMKKGGNLESVEETGLQCGIGLENPKRITRSMRKGGESVEEAELQCGKELGNKNVRKGTRGRRNMKAENLVENDEDETGKSMVTLDKFDSEVKEIKEVNEELSMEEVLKEEDGRVVDGMTENAGVNYGTEGCGASASTSGIKNGNSNDLDLEKMTLGEWLDYLEVNLPKQIVDDTEAMILEMRQKAKRYHEFMLQQKNSEKKIELPVD